MEIVYIHTLGLPKMIKIGRKKTCKKATPPLLAPDFQQGGGSTRDTPDISDPTFCRISDHFAVAIHQALRPYFWTGNRRISTYAATYNVCQRKRLKNIFHNRFSKQTLRKYR